MAPAPADGALARQSRNAGGRRTSSPRSCSPARHAAPVEVVHRIRPVKGQIWIPSVDEFPLHEPLLSVSRVQGKEGVDDPTSIERCEGVEGDVGLIQKLRVPASKPILPVPD